MKISVGSQRGLSFPGFLMAVVLLVFVLIGAMKIIPAYIENASIQNAFNAIVRDPEMRNAKISDIRTSFSKRASVSNITAIKADEVEIAKDESGISLSASYTVKTALVANISLLIEFSPSSPQ
jgi:hypothetical protein